MDKNTFFIAASLFIAFLFLLTLGNLFSGYSVLEQDGITLEDYPYPFIKNNVYNNVYIVLPVDYSNKEYSSAMKVAYSLKANQGMLPRIITADKIQEGEFNFIAVGNPCNNQIISQELRTGLCNLGLSSGDGYIKLITHDNSNTLIISGDTLKASEVLSNYDSYPLIGNEITVSGQKSLFLKYN